MKKIILITNVLFWSLQINGQITTPAASPLITMTQKVGLAEISLSYSRPSANARNIFSKEGLVPFDEFWRTGANSPTTLTINEDIELAEQKLTKGSYVIITKPNPIKWTFYLYRKEKGRWSDYLDRKPILTIPVESKKVEHHMESLLIYLDDLKTNSANIVFHWENTLVKIPIKVAVHDKVMASIDKTMAGPSAFQHFQAASYLYKSELDIEKALKYIQIATNSSKPRFFYYRMEALILAKLGRYKAAIASAKRSNELAKEGNVIDAIKLNNASIADWSKH